MTMHPLAPLEHINPILSSHSAKIFRRDSTDIFLVDDALCQRMRLIACLVHLALCIGSYYSEDFSPLLFSRLYENGKTYYPDEEASSICSPVKAMVIFLWVSDIPFRLTATGNFRVQIQT